MQLRPTLKRIDAYVIRWARQEFKRLLHQTKGARDWFDRLRRANPTFFAHWPLWQRPNIGSRVTREGHARFWESPEVKFLRATRQKLNNSALRRREQVMAHVNNARAENDARRAVLRRASSAVRVQNSELQIIGVHGPLAERLT